MLIKCQLLGSLGVGSGHDGGYYGAISLGHAAVSPALNYHGLLAHGSGLAPASSSLSHLDSSLSGYSHGVGGIGPLGAGFYRYAPSVPALTSHAPVAATAYLKSAPVAQPALLKVVPEKHLEHFVSYLSAISMEMLILKSSPLPTGCPSTLCLRVCRQ